MMEKPAHGVRGFLMFDIDGMPYFRVYTSPGGGAFIDYDIAHSDLEVEIIAEDASFYETENGQGPYLDYCSQVLGKGSNSQDDDKDDSSS